MHKIYSDQLHWTTEVRLSISGGSDLVQQIRRRQAQHERAPRCHIFSTELSRCAAVISCGQSSCQATRRMRSGCITSKRNERSPLTALETGLASKNSLTVPPHILLARSKGC